MPGQEMGQPPRKPARQMWEPMTRDRGPLQIGNHRRIVREQRDAVSLGIQGQGDVAEHTPKADDDIVVRDVQSVHRWRRRYVVVCLTTLVCHGPAA